MNDKITLGGVEYPVAAMPLGKLKRALPAFNRAAQGFSNGSFTEAAMGDVIEVIAAGTNMTTEQVEAIPATLIDIVAALQIIAELCGLSEPVVGEVPPAAETDSTNSTAG